MSAPASATALAAASSAANALAELLRFAREGEPPVANGAFEPDTIEQLADALKLAIDVELPAVLANGIDQEGAEMLAQLSAALARFLEGWA
ncbi:MULTISPECIES: hypothetical protein [unclassified Sphingomonas]|jgi:hypothetical protein|uniref:hypothetical protein n=1 Tax=unclassified Sphingomonas TaxID=196159 RepID=UPI00083217D4|nr:MULTISPECIES: hypothetical protein [unclassified Sphingomonas]